MPSWFELARDFVRECRNGERTGFAKYGEFDPTTDKRILSQEAIEETRDCWVYLDFLKRKRPDLNGKIVDAKQITFDLYRVLRELKGLELNTEKGR